MSNAARYINEHYHENVTLSTVAALSGFNPKYFSKLFNEYFKMGFADYLQKIRLEAAVKLLTDSDVKITSIPNKIGLSSFSTFAKNFKKYTGYSPLQYKDKFRKMWFVWRILTLFLISWFQSTSLRTCFGNI